MACPPYEFLWIVKESAYNTQKGSLVAGTDSIYVRLSGANRFGMRAVAKKLKIPFGGGFASPGYAKAYQWDIMGSLELELCYGQAQLLLDWALTPINAGQTVPWTTTEPPCDLASCVVYHGIQRDDGTIKRTRYKGVKVPSARISSSAANGSTMLQLQLRASQKDGNAFYTTTDPDATAFPAPADTAFPTDPVLFYHTNGLISVGGALAYVTSIELNIDNHLDHQFFSSPYIVKDRKRGRSATASANVLYTATPNWRSDLEALTSRAASFGWTDGTTTLTVDYQGNNLLDTLTDDLQPGQQYMQKVDWEYQRDTSTGDITFTLA